MTVSRVITIDGPSGCGKSSIAQALTKTLSCRLLDSGALYRLVAWLANDAETQQKDFYLSINIDDIQFLPAEMGHSAQIVYQGENRTNVLRHPSMAEKASLIAADADVRHALIAIQRAFAQSPCLIAEGRDMGTTIFPDATLKFYLTADIDVRTERRAKQLQSNGESVNIDDLRNAIAQRDQRDATRKNSPMLPAPDAVCIDTTALTFQQAVDVIMNHINATH